MNLRTLIGQVGRLLAVMVLLHAMLIALSLGIQPLDRPVDVLAHRQSIHRGQFRTVVRGLLESVPFDDRALVIVGASNALLGFRPAEIEEMQPGLRVHNLATASMRADEMRDVVQVAWSLESEAARARTTFVVALLFASFPGPNSVYVRRSDGIAAELRGSRLFREDGGRFVPRWNARVMRLAALLQRPFALADTLRYEAARAAYGVRSFLAAAYFERKLDLAALARKDQSDEMLFPRADGTEGRAASLAFFQAALPGGADALDAAQVDEVLELCRWASANGVDLVLLAMPAPQWTRDGLPFYGRYRAALERIENEARTSASVHFADLTDADVPMWDATHPDPKGTRAWAAALVDALTSASHAGAADGPAPAAERR